MDIPRPQNARAKRIRRIFYVGGSIVVLLLITVDLSRLKPAAAYRGGRHGLHGCGKTRVHVTQCMRNWDADTGGNSVDSG